MGKVSLTPRWSTPALLGVGAALCALGYLAGIRTVRNRDAAASGVVASAAALGQSVSPPPRDEIAERGPMPGPLAAEKVRAAFLATLAAHDHGGAFALAAAEPNWRLRTLLRDAVLRGWATTAPVEAARFALTLPEYERREAVAALLQGASNHPETAAAVAAMLCSGDPALAEEHGRALIAALVETGDYSVLMRFAAADRAGHRDEWLSATFNRWAERSPAAARAALDALSVPTARLAAFQGLALGWAQADPQELAGFAATLPAGEERSLAMQAALGPWMLRDADAVARWVLQFDPGPEFDLSAATLATAPNLIAQKPAVALGWAQSILDPALRESTLTTLARQWAGHDLAGARRLVEQTGELLPEDRRVLVESLASPPDEL